jgi:hypothetical protein
VEAETLRIKDGGDDAEETAAANEGHEDRVAAGEALLLHQRGRVVHDGVDAVNWPRKTTTSA